MRGITPHGKAGTQVLRPDGRGKEGRHAREKKNIYQRKDRKRKMDKNSYTDRDEHMEVKRQLGRLVRKTNRQ